MERYSQRLNQLMGKPSIINKDPAHDLALKWLAAMDVDMTQLTKLKWTVHQLHYLLRGATNTVTLPIYDVRFGTIHYPARNNLPAMNQSQVKVEILGTTKELQELKINVKALSLSRRPLLLITNALNLMRTPNPPMERLRNLSEVKPSPPDLA